MRKQQPSGVATACPTADKLGKLNEVKSNDVDRSPHATLAVDDLASRTRLHAGPKAELSYTLDSADSPWVMHGVVILVVNVES